MPKLTFTVRKASDLAAQKTAALVLPVFKSKPIDSRIKPVDAALGGSIKQVIDLEDFTGESGSTQWLPGVGGLQRVLLVGFGDAEDTSTQKEQKFCDTVAKALAGCKAKEAMIDLSAVPHADEDGSKLPERLGTALARALYRYTETLTKKQEAPTLRKVVVAPCDRIGTSKVRAALETGFIIGEASNFTRELVNLPGNICTPTYLAQQARKLGRRYNKLKVTVLDEKKMRELGMGSLLSVGHGSDQPSQLILMEYKGGKAKEAPYSLVGKGITFDTGGISLKPGPKMDEMKFDMGGAGSVFGAMQAVAELDLKINLVGVVAAAENMPSGRATKPGDVVKSLSGKTIEILNTDAEGRLVLCDALTYVQQRYKPREIVDIATLTGAIIVSLGNCATGIFSNNDELADALIDAGQKSDDRGWRLPIWDDYQSQLDSNFADVANIGGAGAGSITAACFLARFIEDTPWAHLDVAGTAFQSAPKGATGRPVPLLVEYLRKRAGKA
ncbi:MAG: leucyl aminopeptidase [Halieaceae bacterium]|jgi:leucyl aminopeptidase|nr:leucyl aminopeptidase [Halieaceae bacterium]